MVTKNHTLGKTCKGPFCVLYFFSGSSKRLKSGGLPKGLSVRFLRDVFCSRDAHFIGMLCSTDGTRNISNCMSIGADFDKIHPGLEKEAEIRGWWDKSKDGPFNWARDVGGEGTIDKIKAANTRFDCGDKLLKEHAKNREK